MSLRIPSNLKSEIAKFAQEEHLTYDEAVLCLIKAGLSATKSASTSLLEQGLGLFGCPADAALLDEVVAIAYEERRRPAKARLMMD